MNQQDIDYIKLLFEPLVTKSTLEYGYIKEHLTAIRLQQEDSKQERKEIHSTIHQLIMRDNERCLNCFNSKQIEELSKKVDKNKDEYEEESLNSRFYSKNPNIFIGAVAASVFLLFCTFFGGYYAISNKQNSIEGKVTNIEKLQKKESQETDSMYKDEIKSINKK